MRLPARGHRVAVAPGERVLAQAVVVGGGALAGTRDALYLPASPDPSVAPGDTRRIPWEQVEAADWDADSAVLRVSEVGSWGEQRPEHAFTLEPSRRLLQLIRERVSASVVLQRHVPVAGSRGLRVIARRSPGRTAPVQWFYEYDAGVDPEDPAVRRAATEALRAARDDVGPD